MYVSGDIKRTLTLENNSYAIAFTPNTKSILVDIRPFSGAFYLTGGLVKQNINLNLMGNSLSTTFDFNGTTYATNDLADFEGQTDFKNLTAPYLGLGWSNRNNSSSGLAFSFQTGVIDVGRGNVDLSVTCGSMLTSTQCSRLQTDLASEEAKIDSKLNKKLYYSVVKLGLSYHF